MSDTLTIEHPGAKVAAELANAIEAEAAAQAAVGAATLAAVTGSTPVPAAVHRALEAAQQRRQGLEAALVAADRVGAAQADQAHAARRQKRLDDIEATLGDMQAALEDIDKALLAIAKTGAGPRARDAIKKLRLLVGDATESALTPEGWHVATTLGELRGRQETWVDDMAGAVFLQALRGVPEPHGSAMLAGVLRKRLAADLAAQPADWPQSLL